jgi:asparagine synthase (glutamine-hydrolysing)
MCGIVGAFVFNDNNFIVSENYINRMRDTMVHRGPDGAGTWVGEDGRIGLGHRRLAIIDLSDAAAQPMCNEDGTLWVCFNGEIYNHAEIRDELERMGSHQWKTSHSDTEVILHAFEEWGIECVNRFRGMFALALWDVGREELWLIRDRIGKKPLYYSIHHNRITFASEIKALLQDPEQKREVNEEAFYHYLSFLTTPAPQTMFDGIKKLPGATWLRISKDGQVRQHRYWDVLDNLTPMIGFSEEEIAAKILDELRVAVKLRKVGDVPVGVFLSGGIDSSTNAALFSEGESKPVKTFSIGYDRNYESYQNELQYARMMANAVGADQHERLLDIGDTIDFIYNMVYLQDEPIADPVCVPVYYVAELARRNGVIVCQIGEGADELFVGYDGWLRILRVQRLSDIFSPWLFKISQQALKLTGKRKTFPYERLRRAAHKQPVFFSGAEAFTEEHKNQIISPRLRSKFAYLSSWEVIEPIYTRFKEKKVENSPIDWMSYVDLNLRLPELLLMRVDKMTMGASLEGRAPFLDHNFVELAMSIPEALKIKNGTVKYILKKAVKGLIPDELLNRRKQGFGIPIREWFFETLGKKMRKDMENFCKKTDYLDYSEVMNLINRGHAQPTWYLYNFALWWTQYIAGE